MLDLSLLEDCKLLNLPAVRVFTNWFKHNLYGGAYDGKQNYFVNLRNGLSQSTYDQIITYFLGQSSVYTDSMNLSEWHIYGSSRLGIYQTSINMAYRNVRIVSGVTTQETNTTVTLPSYTLFAVERYELTNHLGNVLVVVSDKNIQVCTSTTISYYVADLVSATDYSPFGAPLAGRTYTAPNISYRFSFNGKELDQEGLGGGGSTYDYGFRIYNAQLGKFLSVDPLTKSYPWYTPYQFAGNKPIIAIDIDGLEEWIIIRRIDFGNNTVVSTIKYNPGHRGEGVQYSFIKVNTGAGGGNTSLGTLNYPDFIPGTIDKQVSTQQYYYYENSDDAKNKTNRQLGVMGKNGVNIAQGKYINALQRLDNRKFSNSVPPMTEYYDNDQFSGSNFNAGAVADLMIANPVLWAKIEGFTDSKNSDDYNMKLSKKRADNLRNSIINAAKSSNKYTAEQIESLEKRITSEGKGEEAAKLANGDNVDDSNSRKTTVTITSKQP